MVSCLKELGCQEKKLLRGNRHIDIPPTPLSRKERYSFQNWTYKTKERITLLNLFQITDQQLYYQGQCIKEEFSEILRSELYTNREKRGFYSFFSDAFGISKAIRKFLFTSMNRWLTVTYWERHPFDVTD